MNPDSGLDPSSNNNVDRSVVFEALQAAGSLEADVNNTGAINVPTADSPDAAFLAREAAKKRNRRIRFGALAFVIVAGIVAMFIHSAGTTNKELANARVDASQRFSNTTIPIATVSGGGALSVQNDQTLSINGQLNVNNSVVLTPTKQPNGAVTGQLYYDQTSNLLAYFNGREFVNLLSGSSPASTSINGVTGSIATGDGIALANNRLSNTGVLTLQGETGNVTLTSGSGILVNGTTLSNTGLLSLGGQHGDIALGDGLAIDNSSLHNTGIISATGAGTITVTNDGNGNIVIDGPNGGSGGTVASPGGTSGKIAKFTGVQTIADSLLSDNGTTVSVGGNLSVSGTVTLSTPLAVTSGGTGANSAAAARTNLGVAKSGANNDITSLSGLTTALTVAQGGTGVGTLPTNSVLLGNGTSGLSSVVAGASGLCLVSTGGAPTFQTCPGSGGVASVDGLTGALTLANTSFSGTTITIDNASAGAKGIASFNATNFLVTSGAVNTVQDIAVSSSPSFAGLTLANPLSVASGGTGRNSLTSGGVVVGNGSSAVTTTTGTNGQCLVVSGTTPTFQTCPGSGGVTTVNAANGAITIQGTAGSSVSTVGGVITINDASGTTKGLASFNSTNFTVSSGAVNTVQDIATTSAPSFGQLSIVSNQAAGKMLTINNTNAAATGNLLDLQLNGVSKLSVSPNGSLTSSGNASIGGTITSGLINGQTINSSANFTGSLNVAGTLSVNTIAPTGALTVGVGSQNFTLQGNTGSTLKATNGTSTTTVGFQSPTANVTYSFAAAAAGNYDICTTAGNCTGVGGGVTTAGGTAGKIAKFTSGSGIGDSIISDNGSTVTIGGALSVNTITPTGALTVGSTGQNLTLQGAAVTLAATNSGVTNSLVFVTPSGSGKTISLPNASGTVAVSASGPLVLDAFGNLSCPTCLSGGGGGGTGVSSLNGLSGALTLQGSDSNSITNAGTTITVHDATSGIKGLASFNATNLTVTSGNVNTIQDIAVTSTPTFAGLNLSSALTIPNGGTGATSASGARANLGAAESGANSSITSLSGLTTALSVVQGGTGVATTPTNGQILIGNGSGYSLNTLTAGAGVTITNTAGTITIASPGSGTCSNCAATTLNNLSSVAINTSLLPGVAGGANLGSSTLPFGQLSLSGTSISPGTNNFLITGASTGGTRTITLPDASGTVAVSASGYLNLSASGNLTFVGPLAVTDGGTGANSAAGARTNLGAAKSGANNDITSLSGLTTPLSVGQGGIGTGSLTANQLLYASTSSTIGQLSNGSSGLCLISNGAGAAPSFQTCTGAGGVSSVDSLSGAISINNTSGSGATITIDNAKADGATKGIASFNSTNFSDNGGGVINTIQGIATTSSPTFASLTLSGTLTANTITPTAALTVGSTGQAFTLQGSAASTITTTGGGFVTTIGFTGIPTGSVTYNFDRAAAAGNYTICTTAGNCTGGSGGVGGSGTTGNIAKFTGVNTLGNSLLSESGSTVTANGTLNAVSGFQYNGVTGSTTTCSGGQFLQNQVVQGGIVTGGTCVSGAAGGVTTVGALDGGTANANGATISGSTIYLQSASASFAGLVNTGAQTFAGNKTFSGSVLTSTLDTSAAATLSLGTTNASAINIGKSGVTTTVTGSLTQLTGAVSLTGNATSSISTTTGSLTLTSASTTTWSTNAGTLTLQGAGGASLVTANGAGSTSGITIQSGNAGAGASGNVAIDTGTFTSGTPTISIGTTNASAVNIGNTNTTTTVSGQLIDNQQIQINGTFTTSANSRLWLTGTLNSSFTGSQYGIQNQVNFNPSGASVTGIYGFVNSPTISGSSLNIANVIGAGSTVNTSAGYTGTITNAAAFQASDPLISGSKQYTNFYQFLGVATNGNTGNTSGTINNYQFAANGSTAGAGAGGTLNNYGVKIVQSSGTGGNTSNYGLYISGNGASSGTGVNYAIFSTSTAASLLSGSFQATTINATTGYSLNGTSGSTLTCTSGNALTNAVIQGGIVTGGGCTSVASGINTIGALDGGTANATGATISGSTLYLQSASGTYAGLVNTGTQTFAGAKTFSGNTTLNGTLTATSTFALGSLQMLSGSMVSNSCNVAGCFLTLKGDGGGTIVLENANNGDYIDIGGHSTFASTSDGNTATLYARNNYAGATKPVAVIQEGATPGAAADALQILTSTSAVLAKFDNIGNLQAPTVNAVSGFKFNGTSGSTISCSGGQLLQNQVVQGGIVTGGSCVAAGTGGITTIGALDGGTANATGATISGSTLYLQSASASFAGLVNTGTQTFAGAKTFSGGIISSNLSSAANLTLASVAGGTLTLSSNTGTVNVGTDASQIQIGNGSSTTTNVSGVFQLFGRNGNDLIASGSVSNSATSSLIQIGNAIAGGNALANGGTYLGLNAPSSGAGSAADLVNFQHGGTSVFTVNASGGTSMYGDVLAAANLTVGQTLHVNSDATFYGSNYLEGNTAVMTTSATAFSIQNATSVSYFNVDTSTGTITLGNAASGNYITVSSTGLNAFGTTQHTKTLARTAEYAGAVLNASSDSSCSAANNGNMTSGYDSTNAMSYYDWTSSATAQCYDIVVRVNLPSDFNGWSSNTPLSFKGYTTSTSTGLLNIDLRDTTNTSVAGCAYVNATPGSTSTWTDTGNTCNFSGGTYTAGGTITLRIRMTANSPDDVRAGDLVLSYKSKF